MVAIFESASALLTPEFVESLDPETLASKFLKVEKEYGVKFNKTQHTFNIVGHWEAVRSAHRSLVKLSHRDEDGWQNQSLETTTEAGRRDHDTVDCEARAETGNRDFETPAAEYEDSGTPAEKEAASGDPPESLNIAKKEASRGSSPESRVEAKSVPAIYKIKGNPKRGRYAGERSCTGGLPAPVVFLQYHEESYTEQDKVNLDAVIEEYDRGQVNKKVTKEDLKKMLEKNTEQMGRPLNKSLPRGARLPAKKRDLRAFTSEVVTRKDATMEAVATSVDVVQGRGDSGAAVQYADNGSGFVQASSHGTFRQATTKSVHVQASNHSAFVEATSHSVFEQPSSNSQFTFVQSNSNSQCSYVQSNPYSQSTYVQAPLDSQSAFIQSLPNTQAAFVQSLTNSQSFLQSQTLGQSLLQSQTIGQSFVIQPAVTSQSFLIQSPAINQSFAQPQVSSQSYVIQPQVTSQSVLQPTAIGQSFVQPQRTSQLPAEIAAENTHLFNGQERYINNVNNPYSSLGDISWLSYNTQGYLGADSETNNQGQVTDSGIQGEITETSDTSIASVQALPHELKPVAIVDVDSANKTAEQTLSTVTPVVQILTGIDSLAIDRSPIKELAELKPARSMIGETSRLLLHNTWRPTALKDDPSTPLQEDSCLPVLHQMAAPITDSERTVRADFKTDRSVQAVLNEDTCISSSGKSVFAGAGLSALPISLPQQTQISQSPTPVLPVESSGILARSHSIMPGLHEERVGISERSQSKDHVSTAQSAGISMSSQCTTSVTNTDTLLGLSSTVPSMKSASHTQGHGIAAIPSPQTSTSHAERLLGISPIASSITPVSYAEGLGLLAISTSMTPVSCTEGLGLSSKSASVAYSVQRGELGLPATSTSMTGMTPVSHPEGHPEGHRQVDGMSATSYSLQSGELGLQTQVEDRHTQDLHARHRQVEGVSAMLSPMEAVSDGEDTDDGGTAATGGGNVTVMVSGDTVVVVDQGDGGLVESQQPVVQRPDCDRSLLEADPTWPKPPCSPMQDTSAIKKEHSMEVAAIDTLVPQAEDPRAEEVESKTRNTGVAMETSGVVAIETTESSARQSKGKDVAGSATSHVEKAKRTPSRRRGEKRPVKTKTASPPNTEPVSGGSEAPSTDNTQTNQDSLPAKTKKPVKKPRAAKATPKTKASQKSKAAAASQEPVWSADQETAPSTTLSKPPQIEDKPDTMTTQGSDVAPQAERTQKSSTVKKPPLVYECPECDYVGPRKKRLTEHMGRVHGLLTENCRGTQERISFACDLCDKTFVFGKDLNRHKKIVHHGQVHYCNVCQKSYKAKYVFDKHMATHEEGYVQPMFPCKICDKQFTTKFSLTSHVKSEHLGLKKTFICPTCGKTFSQIRSYRQHANVHAGIRPYSCEICGKSFTYDKSLKEHRYMHDNIRRFQCPECGKSFRQRTCLLIHQKVHKDTKDHICSSCGKGFTQRQSLIRHERTHSGDKPYTCKLCLKSFSDYAVIRKHMLMSHKKDKADWKNDIAAEVQKASDHYIAGGPGYVPREPATRVRERKMATVIPPLKPGGATTIIDHGDNIKQESALVGLVGETIVNAGQPVVSMYGNISASNILDVHSDQGSHCSPVAIQPQGGSVVPDHSPYQPLSSSLYSNNTYTMAPNTVIPQDLVPNQTVQNLGNSASPHTPIQHLTIGGSVSPQTQIQHLTIGGSASPQTQIQHLTIGRSASPQTPIQHLTIGGSGSASESSLNIKPQDLESSLQAAGITVNYSNLQAAPQHSFTISDPTSITVDDNMVAAFLKSQGRQSLQGTTDIFASLGSLGAASTQGMVLEQTQRSEGQGDMTYVMPSVAMTTNGTEPAVSNADVTTATSNISWGYPPGYPGYYNSAANYAQFPSSQQNQQ